MLPACPPSRSTQTGGARRALGEEERERANFGDRLGNATLYESCKKKYA